MIDRPNSDFIDREQQLPVDLSASGSSDVAGDRAKLQDAQATPIGEPAMDYTVRSVYDVKPLQAIGFNITAPAVELDKSGAVVVSFQVPQGYVAVVRGIIHSIDNPGARNRSQVLLSMLLNGADVPYNKNIPVGNETDGSFPKLFFIADEYSTVAARFTASTPTDVTSLLYVTFFGDLLVKTGRPAIMEIANPTGATKTAAAAPLMEREATITYSGS